MLVSVFKAVSCCLAILESPYCIIDFVYRLLAISGLKGMFSDLRCEHLGKELRSYCQSLMLRPVNDSS